MSTTLKSLLLSALLAFAVPSFAGTNEGDAPCEDENADVSTGLCSTTGAYTGINASGGATYPPKFYFEGAHLGDGNISQLELNGPSMHYLLEVRNYLRIPMHDDTQGVRHSTHRGNFCYTDEVVRLWLDEDLDNSEFTIGNNYTLTYVGYDSDADGSDDTITVEVTNQSASFDWIEVDAPDDELIVQQFDFGQEGDTIVGDSDTFRVIHIDQPQSDACISNRLRRLGTRVGIDVNAPLLIGGQKFSFLMAFWLDDADISADTSFPNQVWIDDGRGGGTAYDNAVNGDEMVDIESSWFRTMTGAQLKDEFTNYFDTNCIDPPCAVFDKNDTTYNWDFDDFFGVGNHDWDDECYEVDGSGDHVTTLSDVAKCPIAEVNFNTGGGVANFNGFAVDNDQEIVRLAAAWQVYHNIVAWNADGATLGTKFTWNWNTLGLSQSTRNSDCVPASFSNMFRGPARDEDQDGITKSGGCDGFITDIGNGTNVHNPIGVHAYGVSEADFINKILAIFDGYSDTSKYICRNSRTSAEPFRGMHTFPHVNAHASWMGECAASKGFDWDVPGSPVMENQTFSVPENTANSTLVDTLVWTDPDAGDTFTFTFISGNTGTTFAVNNDGEITVLDNTLLDYESLTSFGMSMEVTDQTNRSDTAGITINVTNVNEAPTVPNDTVSIDENAPVGTVVTTVVGTDPDAGDTLDYTITAGNASGAFTIGTTSGIITVADSSPLDFETTPQFVLTVQGEDDGLLTDTGTITINLNDVSEGGGGGEFYANPSGSGTEDGSSPANAWSLADAYDNASDGDLVNLAVGTYGSWTETSAPTTTRTDYATFRCINPITSGDSGGCDFTDVNIDHSGSAYVAIEGLNVYWSDQTGAKTLVTLNADDIKFTHDTASGIKGTCRVRAEKSWRNGGGRQGYTVSGTDVTVEGCFTEEMGKRCVGMSYPTNFHFKNNVCITEGGSGIQYGGLNGIIEGNHIYMRAYDPHPNQGGTDTDVFQNGVGARFGPHTSGISIRSDDVIIRYNYIHDIGTTGAIQTYEPDAITHSSALDGYDNIWIYGNIISEPPNTHGIFNYCPGDDMRIVGNTIVGHLNQNTTQCTTDVHGRSNTYFNQRNRWSGGIATRTVGCDAAYSGVPGGMTVSSNLVQGTIAIPAGVLANTVRNNLMQSGTDEVGARYPDAAPDADGNLALLDDTCSSGTLNCCSDSVVNPAFDLEFHASTNPDAIWAGTPLYVDVKRDVMASSTLSWDSTFENHTILAGGLADGHGHASDLATYAPEYIAGVDSSQFVILATRSGEDDAGAVPVGVGFPGSAWSATVTIGMPTNSDVNGYRLFDQLGSSKNPFTDTQLGPDNLLSTDCVEVLSTRDNLYVAVEGDISRTSAIATAGSDTCTRTFDEVGNEL